MLLTQSFVTISPLSVASAGLFHPIGSLAEDAAGSAAGDTRRPRTVTEAVGEVDQEFSECEQDVALSEPAERPLNRTLAGKCWLLGTMWAAAAIAELMDGQADRGTAAKTPTSRLAAELGIQVPELPTLTKTSKSEDLKVTLRFLADGRKQIVRDLSQKYGRSEGFFADLAINAQLAPLAARIQHTSLLEGIVANLKRAAALGELPTEAWKPLADALEAKATKSDIATAQKHLRDVVVAFLKENDKIAP